MSVMTRQLKIPALLLLGLVALGLSACDSVPSASTLFAQPSSIYDGAWVGRMSVGIQTPKCTTRRGGIRISVTGGRIDGIVRSDGETSRLSGVIEEDGSLVGGKMAADNARFDVEFVGNFTEKSASGTWKNQYCTGEWELSKAR